MWSIIPESHHHHPRLSRILFQSSRCHQQYCSFCKEAMSHTLFAVSITFLIGVCFFHVLSGANFVEDASGRITHLERLSELRRRAVAARLLASPGQKVSVSACGLSIICSKNAFLCSTVNVSVFLSPLLPASSICSHDAPSFFRHWMF